MWNGVRISLLGLKRKLAVGEKVNWSKHAQESSNYLKLFGCREL